MRGGAGGGTDPGLNPQNNCDDLM
jgi:hypothetical protein